MKNFCRYLYWSVWAAITKYHSLGGLNNINLFHIFACWEVQNQGAGHFDVWWRLSSWFAFDHLLTVSSYGRKSELSGASSCKYTNHNISEPQPYDLI